MGGNLRSSDAGEMVFIGRGAPPSEALAVQRTKSNNGRVLRALYVSVLGTFRERTLEHSCYTIPTVEYAKGETESVLFLK